MSMKSCTKCGQQKPATVEYFTRRRTAKDGLRNMCRDCCAEYHRNWQDAHPGYATAQSNKWREENPEAFRAHQYKWFVANSTRQAVARRRHRAQKYGATGDHSFNDVLLQYQAQQGKCYYCEINVGDDYHVDHVVPLTRGGSNGPENIVIACPSCNCSKGNRLPFEWTERVGAL